MRDSAPDEASLAASHEQIGRLRREIARVVVGQQRAVDRAIIALLVRGHLLIEGVPGLAKTLLVRAISGSIGGSFHRIQFTPDLLPADITGTLIFDPANSRFNVRMGPVFANLVLADEINRAPAKVQSALLEAMQERQVTIGDRSYRLPEPFVVVATQNPIEQEGTYVLPEAQVDRFLMKVRMSYPSAQEEAEMLSLYLNPLERGAAVEKVLSVEQISELSAVTSRVHLDERIVRYIVEVVHATRDPAAAGAPDLQPMISFGASPRATLALAHVAKGQALLEGRPFVIPDDIKSVAHDVLRHRIMVSFEAAATGLDSDAVIDRVLSTVRVP